MTSPNLNGTSLGVQLRQRRKAQRLTLQALEKMAGVSFQFISEIERGVKTPTRDTLSRLKTALGITEELPGEYGPRPAPQPEDVKANLGACLLAAGEKGVALGHLAREIGIGVGPLRVALRDLEATLAPAAMVVIDDGWTARLSSHPAKAALVRAVLAKPPMGPLTIRQLEVLVMVILRESATHRQIQGVRGVDSHAVLDELVERGYLECLVLDDEPGKPIRYAPTSKILHELGFSTFEELRTSVFKPRGLSSWAELRERLGFKDELVDEGER